MRKKGEKGAPTPAQLKRAKGEELEKEDLNEWGEIEEESEYQGRKVTLNKPTAGDVKKSKVYVKNEKGTVVKVNFGDPNMTIKKSNPARRKSSVRDTIVTIPAQNGKQDIGLVKHGNT